MKYNLFENKLKKYQHKLNNKNNNKHLIYKSKINYYVKKINQTGGFSVYNQCKNILEGRATPESEIPESAIPLDKNDRIFLKCFKKLFDIDSSDSLDSFELPKIVIKGENQTSSFYLMEDPWIQPNPHKISEEYDILKNTGCSQFIFKKNIINMALTVLCYHTRCFDKMFELKIKDDIQNRLDSIHFGFEENKHDFCNMILEAYKDCNYRKIVMMYLYFIEFYNFYISPYYDNNGNYNFNDSYQLIKKILKNNKKIYVYLSFNSPLPWKMINFLLTKIVVSNIGYKCVHNTICNSINITSHDMMSHNSYERMLNIDNDIFKKIIFYLYDTYYLSNRILYIKIADFIHDSGHESNIIDYAVKDMLRSLLSKINARFEFISYSENMLKSYIAFKEEPDYIYSEFLDQQISNFERDIENTIQKIKDWKDIIKIFLDLFEEFDLLNKENDRETALYQKLKEIIIE